MFDSFESSLDLQIPQGQDDVHISSSNSSEDGSDSGRGMTRISSQVNTQSSDCVIFPETRAFNYESTWDKPIIS